MLGEAYMYRASFFSRTQPGPALRWYKTASNNGDPDASFKVAKLLMEDSNKEAEIQVYLQRALKQGHPEAAKEIFNVSESYRNRYFLSAGDLRIADAMLVIAVKAN